MGSTPCVQTRASTLYPGRGAELAALRPENPDRTAGAIQRILRALSWLATIALRGRGSLSVEARRCAHAGQLAARRHCSSLLLTKVRGGTMLSGTEYAYG